MGDHISEIAQNMRFYADVRFKQLTLLLAAMTVAAAGAAGHAATQLTRTVTVRTFLSVAAMLVVAVLWVMEVRAATYWAAHREKAANVWPAPKRNFFWWLNATNALLVLHACLFVGWWWFGYQWNLHNGWLIVTALLFAMMVSFSIVMYRPLWKHGVSMIT